MTRKLLIKILIKIANLLSKDEKFISSKFLRVLPWLKDKGDDTHSINHPLNENSIVFDLGGYLGDWSLIIFKKYNCNIHIFEPVGNYYFNIKKVLNFPKIKVNQFGLADKTYSTTINIDDEASSIFKKGEQGEEIQLISFLEYVNEHNIKKIDLIKINIEGSEYDLLEHLISEGYIKNIKNIQVQFHDFFPNAKNRMEKIQEQLKKTHHLTFQYPFIWENWRLKL